MVKAPQGHDFTQSRVNYISEKGVTDVGALLM